MKDGLFMVIVLLLLSASICVLGAAAALELDPNLKDAEKVVD